MNNSIKLKGIENVRVEIDVKHYVSKASQSFIISKKILDLDNNLIANTEISIDKNQAMELKTLIRKAIKRLVQISGKYEKVKEVIGSVGEEPYLIVVEFLRDKDMDILGMINIKYKVVDRCIQITPSIGIEIADFIEQELNN